MTSEAPTPFDPGTVPERPVVDITFHLDSRGRTIARVDGLPVKARSEETPRESAVRTVAGLVDRIASTDATGLRSEGVLARVHGANRSVKVVVVHRDGRVFTPSAGGRRLDTGRDDGAAETPLLPPEAAPPPPGADLASGSEAGASPGEPDGVAHDTPSGHETWTDVREAGACEFEADRPESDRPDADGPDADRSEAEGPDADRSEADNLPADDLLAGDPGSGVPLGSSGSGRVAPGATGDRVGGTDAGPHASPPRAADQPGPGTTARGVPGPGGEATPERGGANRRWPGASGVPVGGYALLKRSRSIGAAAAPSAAAAPPARGATGVTAATGLAGAAAVVPGAPGVDAPLRGPANPDDPRLTGSDPAGRPGDPSSPAPDGPDGPDRASRPRGGSTVVPAPGWRPPGPAGDARAVPGVGSAGADAGRGELPADDTDATTNTGATNPDGTDDTDGTDRSGPATPATTWVMTPAPVTDAATDGETVAAPGSTAGTTSGTVPRSGAGSSPGSGTARPRTVDLLSLHRSRDARPESAATATPRAGGATTRTGAATTRTGAAASEPGGSATQARRAPRRVRLRPRAVTAGAVALVVAGAGALLAHSLDGTSPQVTGAPAAAATVLPVVAPHGYLSQVRWSSPRLLPEAGAAVPAGSGLAFVTADRVLHVVDPATGIDRWTTPLPAGAVAGPPAVTLLDGNTVLAMRVGASLTWWNAADGSGAGSLPLPATAHVSYLGAAPLVELDAHTVAVVHAGRLVRAALPAGATALATRRDGTITATAPTGWWHLRPSAKTGKATPWGPDDPDPSAAAPRPVVAGYLGTTIVAVTGPDRARRRHIVAYGDGERVSVSFRALLADESPAANPDGRSWHPSPSRTWGILGRALIDLTAGRVVDLGAWRTTWVAQDRAYGRLGADAVVVGPALPRGVLGPESSVTEAQTPAGAVVRVREGSDERIYLVPPAR